MCSTRGLRKHPDCLTDESVRRWHQSCEGSKFLMSASLRAEIVRLVLSVGSNLPLLAILGVWVGLLLVIITILGDCFPFRGQFLQHVGQSHLRRNFPSSSRLLNVLQETHAGNKKTNPKPNPLIIFWAWNLMLFYIPCNVHFCIFKIQTFFSEVQLLGKTREIILCGVCDFKKSGLSF